MCAYAKFNNMEQKAIKSDEMAKIMRNYVQIETLLKAIMNFDDIPAVIKEEKKSCL